MVHPVLDAPPRERRGPRTGGRDALVVAAALTAFVLVAQWGATLVAADVKLRLGAAPFAGGWASIWSGPMLLAIGAGIGLAVLADRLARRAQWPLLLTSSAAIAATWAVTLAATEGRAGLVGALGSRYDYLAAVPDIGNPIEFLRSFVDQLPTLPVHGQSHPPGMVLLLDGLDALGLGGTGWTAALVLAGGAASVPAVLLAVADVVDEPAARRVAPFLALAPAAVWWSSADALFTGVGAWAVALLVLATNPDRVRADRVAVLGGGLLAAALLLSYGAVLLLAIPAIVAARRGRWRALAPAAVVVAGAYLALRAVGFDWYAGLSATRTAYADGVASLRPDGYFLVANLVVVAAMVGPATAVALGRVRPSPRWWLCGAALLAVLAADLSGLAKGEVERIWLPFSPWLIVATAALGRTRPWLAANVGLGLSLQCFLRSPW